MSDRLDRLKSAFGKRGSGKGQPARDDGETDALDRLRTTLADRYVINVVLNTNSDDLFGRTNVSWSTMVLRSAD